jgi:hypothetical protein
MRLIIVAIVLLIVFVLFVKFNAPDSESYTNSPWYQKGIGFTAFDTKLPNYEEKPNLMTAIGGMKGNYKNYPAYGVYDAEVKHMATGTPQRARATRTILKPEYVGFSANSIVNRNYYDDIYNHVGDRKQNPIFQYITKEKGLSTVPTASRYAEPQYRFSII